ncbi:mercury resistance system transport protein MerF [Halomonas sp.]|nr:mercury resistance system transport protein MerF [Halomonas sp.]
MAVGRCNVLLPALAGFIGLIAYALWRKTRTDACCRQASRDSRSSPNE